jgi:hypothetical protein
MKRLYVEEFGFVSRSGNRRAGVGVPSCLPPFTVLASRDRNKPWPILVRSARYPIARIFKTEAVREPKFFAQQAAPTAITGFETL